MSIKDFGGKVQAWFRERAADEISSIFIIGACILSLIVLIFFTDKEGGGVGCRFNAQIRINSK